MKTMKYITILLFLFVLSLSGCTFAHVTETIGRTPAKVTRQGEGVYQYYILIKGKDGKMHLYPITMPKQEKPKTEKTTKPAKRTKEEK